MNPEPLGGGGGGVGKGKGREGGVSKCHVMNCRRCAAAAAAAAAESTVLKKGERKPQTLLMGPIPTTTINAFWYLKSPPTPPHRPRFPVKKMN